MWPSGRGGAVSLVGDKRKFTNNESYDESRDSQGVKRVEFVEADIKRIIHEFLTNFQVEVIFAARGFLACFPPNWVKLP